MVQTLTQLEISDRVRAHSPQNANDKIDYELEERIRFYGTQNRAAVEFRLAELNREWDIERVLQTNAASISLAGLLLGIAVNRRWLALPVIVSGFLLQHAIQGWCPPVPVFRKLGVRTQKEIERERYALKALLGGFDSATNNRNPEALIRNTI
jgi:hypothetical protein